MNELPPNHNRGQWQSLFVSHTDKATHCLIDCLFNGLSLSVGFRPIGPQTPSMPWLPLVNCPMWKYLTGA